MATRLHEECPNCDDSELDIQVLDERHDETLGLHWKACRWVCLNCSWASEQWEATD